MFESLIKEISHVSEVSNLNYFSSKLKNFINSYKNKKNNLALITDFDFTITKRYNYEKNELLFSSYRFYDEDLIGGNQQRITEIQNELCNKYMKYEIDATIDINIRKKYVYEFYAKSLDVYINPKFKRESIGIMLDKLKDKFELRKYTKEFFELLLKLDIPIIIVSGGIREVIIDLLKKNVNDFELYCQKKKIIIISNELIFDKEKGCIGYSKDVIHALNKSSFVKEVMKKNYPEIENILLLGDHLNDYDCVKDLDLTNQSVIGAGFINIKPEFIKNESKKEEIENTVNNYKQVYDINFIGDTDFSLLIKILKLFKEERE